MQCTAKFSLAKGQVTGGRGWRKMVASGCPGRGLKVVARPRLYQTLTEAEQKPQILEEKPQTAHYWGPYSCTPEDSPLPVYPANTIESCLKTIVPSLKLLLGCAGQCPCDHCELPTGSCDPSFSNGFTKAGRPKSFSSIQPEKS
jgi:hypothetical protein